GILNGPALGGAGPPSMSWLTHSSSSTCSVSPPSTVAAFAVAPPCPAWPEPSLASEPKTNTPAANATMAAPTMSPGSTRAPDTRRGGPRPARLAPAPSDRILSPRWMADTAGPSEAAAPADRLPAIWRISRADHPPFGGAGHGNECRRRSERRIAVNQSEALVQISELM